MAAVTDALAEIVARLAAIRRDAGYATDVRRAIAGSVDAPGDLPVPALAARVVTERVRHLPARYRKREARVLVGAIARAAAGKSAEDAARALLEDADRALSIDPTLGGRVTRVSPGERRVFPSGAGDTARGFLVVEMILHETAPGPGEGDAP
ncbi:hypothetical protein K8I61_13960 [bacterium]|nr:hypothetical protein [bacterium]